jgi:hypothetical protein
VGRNDNAAVVSILTEPRYAAGVAFGMKGDLGTVPLDA